LWAGLDFYTWNLSFCPSLHDGIENKIRWPEFETETFMKTSKADETPRKYSNVYSEPIVASVQSLPFFY